MAILRFLIFSTLSSEYLLLSFSHSVLIFVLCLVYVAATFSTTAPVTNHFTEDSTTASPVINPPKVFPKDTNLFKIIYGSKAPMKFPSNTKVNKEDVHLVQALLQHHKQSLELDDLLHGGKYGTTPKILPQEKPDTFRNVQFFVSPLDQVELIENDIEETEDTKFSIKVIQASSSCAFTKTQKQLIVLVVLMLVTIIGGAMLYLKIKSYSG